MENIATTTNYVINNTFWQQIPAAAYVLFGVVISGLFAVYNDHKNCKNNKELKELENKNNKELKELENKNSKEMQVIEVGHKEKLQLLKEKGEKSLRLLDDRIKIFTEFHENFSIMRSGGDFVTQLKNTNTFRVSLYKVKLLNPDLEKELSALDVDVNIYANYFHKGMGKKEYDKSGDIRRQLAKKVIDKTEEIFKQLSRQL